MDRVEVDLCSDVVDHVRELAQRREREALSHQGALKMLARHVSIAVMVGCSWDDIFDTVGDQMSEERWWEVDEHGRRDT